MARSHAKISPFLNNDYPRVRPFSLILPKIDPDDEAPPYFEPEDNVHVLLLGIEAHICILQTALTIRSAPSPPRVSVLADGVSSCNPGERGLAFDRLRAEGCVITTSESVLFEILRGAEHKQFKGVSGLVKGEKGATAEAVKGLCASLYGAGSKL